MAYENDKDSIDSYFIMFLIYFLWNIATGLIQKWLTRLEENFNLDLKSWIKYLNSSNYSRLILTCNSEICCAHMSS